MLQIEDVVLIKINRSYREGMTPKELYEATSRSWVASLEKTDTRDIQYYCAVYTNKIIEVYDFEGYEEEIPKRTPSRYILHGKVTDHETRNKLLGLDVSSIHKGSGNPIKYTNLDVLLSIDNENEEGEVIVDNVHLENLPSHTHAYLTSRGFLYSKENIANLYLSLRSKPFVIISGISGTGKTKIVQLFAESVGATEEDGQFKLISVRPDWSDSSDLLGYKNLQDEFVEGQLTEMVKRAHDNPQLPHFVVLDEMNLARVEYYLSEFLSIMESRRVGEDGEVVSSTLVTTNDREFSLPNNLYIIGTVNMDETTHPFSKKVLDRANTIEFNDIRLTNFDMFEQETEEVAAVRVGNEQFESKYLYLKQAYPQNKELVQKVSTQLELINQQLQTIYAQVGYRVRDEICFYMLYNDEMNLLSENEAFDFCVMQKILPRISGADSTVEDLLKNLFEQFAGEAYEKDKAVSEDAPYPRSAKKVAEMLKRLHKDSFTSFWIS
ncbi:McrB family protein [Lysinibacillus sp. 54212]|uniref:McrB family protein n=1 Tax=Lysinibacillus sp. 54212 TaxID=3119829 RepID=UPI002FCBFB8D